jgi:hypothetical protein
MPYTPYLTDTDRAIDRDANEMLSPQANASGAGYIAQGYANMDVLPEQMALADMLERRQTLSMRSRQGRREQRDEDVAAAEQDEFDGYSGFVRGTAGMNESQRAAAMRDRAINNPSELNNDLINKSRVVMLAGDRAVLDAKENTLRSKQMDLDMRGVEYNDAKFDEKAKLQDMEFGNAVEKAKLTQKQIELTNYQFDNQDTSKLGENIFSINAFGEDRETRDKLIKTIPLLPKDSEDDRNNLRALAEITGGIAIGNQVKNLKSYTDIDNLEFLRNTLKSTGFDLSSLPRDRAERDAFVTNAAAAIMKKGGDMQSFRSYVEKVKGYNDSEEAVNQLTADFTESIGKLEALANSEDPQAKKKLAGEIYLLRAKASGQAAHFQREYTNFENERKIKEDARKVKKEDDEMKIRLNSANVSERRLANLEYSTKLRERLAVSGTKFDRMKEAERIVEDGRQVNIGLDEDATIEDVLNRFDEMAPPVGAGASKKDF